MDPRLFLAVRSGDVALLQQLYADDANLLKSSLTPHGNTALHLAVIFRQEELAKELCSKCPSLLSASNADGNTPLLLAAATGFYPIVAFAPLVDVEEGKQMLTATNKTGNNALHEALKNGHRELALVLLRAEPELARVVNKNGESPLYMACCRRMEVVVEELLRSPTANHEGPNGETALIAAVKLGHSGLVKALLEERPGLAKAKDSYGNTPLHYASGYNKVAVVRLLLDSDASMAYVLGAEGLPPIMWAVVRNYVPIVEEFVRCCPDSAFTATVNGDTLLLIAVIHGNVEVVRYILRTPQLHGLINLLNNAGDGPLHIAVCKYNTMIIQELLACKSLDKAAVNKRGQTAVDVLTSSQEWTARWTSTYWMLKSAFPDHHRFVWWPQVEENLENQKRDAFRHYLDNSMVVATLMATITFAAAFTVPGGYDGNQDANQGLPILARKAAFKAFLISDTIAMCASLAVAFLCIFSPWADDYFLMRYVDSTSRLLASGFAAMSVAFATGLYVVVAPGSLWLAAIICVLCCSLPPVTYLEAKWTVYGDTIKFLMLNMLSKILEKIFKIMKKFLQRETYRE